MCLGIRGKVKRDVSLVTKQEQGSLERQIILFDVCIQYQLTASPLMFTRIKSQNKVDKSRHSVYHSDGISILLVPYLRHSYDCDSGVIYLQNSIHESMVLMMTYTHTTLQI